MSLPTFLYASDTWALTKDDETRIQSPESSRESYFTRPQKKCLDSKFENSNSGRYSDTTDVQNGREQTTAQNANLQSMQRKETMATPRYVGTDLIRGILEEEELDDNDDELLILML